MSSDDLPEPDDIPAVSAEQLVDGHDEHPGDAAPRRYPSTIGGIVFLAVLATAVLGLVLVGTGSWRNGVRLIGVALLGAALARSLLSAGNAGMLAVRHRVLDVVLLIGLGLALLVLASSIPNQPG